MQTGLSDRRPAPIMAAEHPLGSAYTPGLTVSDNVRIEKTRRLPLRGETLVSLGQSVEAETVVARAQLPGDVRLVRAADELGVSGDELLVLLQRSVGDTVAEGELLAETPGLFGRFFRSRLIAPVSGTIEAVTARTGNLAIRQPPKPVELTAYFQGQVMSVLPGEGAVIATQGALVQGIFGVGPERQGILVDAAHVAPGAVVITPGRIALDWYREMCARGASAVVGGSLLDEDLRAILGRDLGLAITGEEDVPATVIITEGFGDVAMAQRTWDLFGRLMGRAASVSGATQIRAGVIRPEVIVPLAAPAPAAVAEAAAEQRLELGARVRLIREPWFGLLGAVTALPPEPITIATGAKMRVLSARLDDGREVVAPRANVEIVVG